MHKPYISHRTRLSKSRSCIIELAAASGRAVAAAMLTNCMGLRFQIEVGNRRTLYSFISFYLPCTAKDVKQPSCTKTSMLRTWKLSCRAHLCMIALLDCLTQTNNLEQTECASCRGTPCCVELQPYVLALSFSTAL